ncbi:unnamed protein product [Auanema sp. JU1783]|nr:unnamed protein product [Auanema sp. JU1783]
MSGKKRTDFSANEDISLRLEFTGGSEFLLTDDQQKELLDLIKVPGFESPFTISSLLEWIDGYLLKDCDNSEMFVKDGELRPGILVLVNECDWELLDGLHSELKNGDKVTFISTLHGG